MTITRRGGSNPPRFFHGCLRRQPDIRPALPCHQSFIPSPPSVWRIPPTYHGIDMKSGEPPLRLDACSQFPFCRIDRPGKRGLTPIGRNRAINDSLRARSSRPARTLPVLASASNPPCRSSHSPPGARSAAPPGDCPSGYGPPTADTYQKSDPHRCRPAAGGDNRARLGSFHRSTGSKKTGAAFLEMPPDPDQPGLFGPGRRLQQCRVPRPGADDELAHARLEKAFRHIDRHFP